MKITVGKVVRWLFFGGAAVFLACMLIKYPVFRAELFDRAALIVAGIIAVLVFVGCSLYALWARWRPDSEEESVCPLCGQEVPPENRRLFLAQTRQRQASSSQVQSPP